jgi:hypothetical protein
VYLKSWNQLVLSRFDAVAVQASAFERVLIGLVFVAVGCKLNGIMRGGEGFGFEGLDCLSIGCFDLWIWEILLVE